MNATPRRREGFGFTLIELIVVMAVLSTVLAVAAPALSRFFQGRKLEEEARRMLALTRYGRSEAVSSAVPMELWLDTKTGSYGIVPVAGYEAEDDRSLEFELADGLCFEVDEQIVGETGRASIFFEPGGVIGEDSLEAFAIWDDAEYLGISRVNIGAEYAIDDKGIAGSTRGAK